MGSIAGDNQPRTSNVLAMSEIIPLLEETNEDSNSMCVAMVSESESQATPSALG